MTEFKTDVPLLERSNYGPWLIALRAAAFNADAIDHLDGNPAEPTNADEQRSFLKKKNYLLGKIITTVLSDIANLLIAPDSDPSPHNLFIQIKEHLNTSNANDHKYLKSLAESTAYLPDMTLSEYVTAHEKIRAKMIASRYPCISDQRTTVEFMIDGLKNNHSPAQIGLQLIALNAADVKEFTQQFNRIQSYQHAPNTLPQPHGLPQSPGNELQEILRLLCRGNINKTSSPPHLRSGFTPCSFHIGKEVRQPRHTDDQCRDPEHPKQYRGTTKRQRAAARAAQADNVTALMAQIQELARENAVTDSDSDDNIEAGTFLLDSAAHPSHTTTPTQNMTPLQARIMTITATNQSSPCTHYGKITIKTGHGKQIHVPALANPSIKQNLISVRTLAQSYGPVIFDKNTALLLDTRFHPSTTVIGTAKWNNSLQGYKLSQFAVPRARGARTQTPNRKKTNPNQNQSQSRQQLPSISAIKRSFNKKPHATIPHLPDTRTTRNFQPRNILTRPANKLTKKPSATTLQFHNWHLKLNHTPLNNLQKMATLNTIPTMPLSLKTTPPHLTCSSCAHAKQRPASHKPNTKTYDVGSYVSSDTCGPINPTSRHGNKHFLTFMDAASRYLILYFIKDRREVLLIITTLFAWLHSHRTTPQTYRTDKAKEFCSKGSQAIYMRYGIEHKTTTPHQPQENSRAERINQTLLNAARAALHHANLDNTYWEDAVRDAAFKYNIMFHSAHGMSPYERWHNRKPCIKRLFSFGKKGHITIHSPKKKLQARAAPAQYMYGLSETQICILNLHTWKYQTVRPSDFHPYDPQSDPVLYNTQAFRTISPTQNTRHPDPQSHKQAKRYEDAPQWAIAHDHEFDNIDATKTIEWIPDEQIPSNTTIIPLKMTYKYKYTTTGDTRRKARCSVRGDRMKPGIHFDPDNTTTYMAEKATVRLLLSMAAAHHWPVEHFDITTAYLQEQYKHNQPVYVKQHARFDGSYKQNCKAGILRGNLYGTPPASNIYFTGLVKHLLAANYTQCQADPCLFYKTSNPSGDTILVAISMDDFLTTSPNRELIDGLYTHLQKNI